ncbi:MAG TPA: ATP-binding protein [Trebonia sp.]
MSATGKKVVAAGVRTATAIQAAWELPYGPLTAAQARGALSSWLAGFGIDPADGPGFDIVLATSEVAANASVHGRPPVLLDAWLERGENGQVVAVCVSDADPELPGPASPSLLAEYGRGLGIVAALALRLDIRQTTDGKEIWFEIAVPSQASVVGNGRASYHNDPFGMNNELNPGPTCGEALAS